MSTSGETRLIYEAALRSGWDNYRNITVIVNANGQRITASDGAIAAARAGDVTRLVDCLRGRKPLTDGDCISLAEFISTRAPLAPRHRPAKNQKKPHVRRWPKRLSDALRDKSDADYDVLADFVEKTGRRRGRQRSEPVHAATRLTEVLMSVSLGSAAAIRRAAEIVSGETDTPVRDEQVRDLLDRPKDRRRKF